MNGRDAGSWVEKTERPFGFRGPQPQSRRRNLFISFSLLGGIFGAAVIFIYASYAGDARQKWIGLALALNAAMPLLSNTAEALYAGAYEGRLVEQGRVLRAVTYVVMFPASVSSFATMGYVLAGTPGVLVGGAVATVYSSVCYLYDLRRARKREAPVHSQPR